MGFSSSVFCSAFFLVDNNDKKNTVTMQSGFNFLVWPILSEVTDILKFSKSWSEISEILNKYYQNSLKIKKKLKISTEIISYWRGPKFPTLASTSFLSIPIRRLLSSSRAAACCRDIGSPIANMAVFAAVDHFSRLSSFNMWLIFAGSYIDFNVKYEVHSLLGSLHI